MVVAGSAMLLAPFAAFAQNTAAVNANVGANAGANVRLDANFCTNLSIASTKVETGVNDKDDTLNKNQTDRLAKVVQDRADRDAKLQQTRTDSDGTRAAEFAKLNLKASTDAQKTAVATFQANMTAAISLRRSAVDAAIASFRTSVSALISSHQGSVNSAATTFKNSVSAAVAQANSSCAAGVAPKTVRATFIASIKAARQQFSTDRKAQQDLGPQVKALEETKDAAITAALNTFKASANQARIALKAAF